jgi:outer membrane protein assembly factor BamE (lipoprotein component of BamABCDE complex)
MRRPIVLALMLYCSPLLAQAALHTISPGMTKAQVITALGEPATSRTVGEDSYLFYLNACGKKCGMNDLVILHADSVADAIFRAPDRHYTGKSSSPTAIPQSVAAREKPGAAGVPVKLHADSTPKRTTRMKPAPANDTRPSIPVHPQVVKAAPATAKPAAAKAAPSTVKPAPTTAKPSTTTKPAPAPAKPAPTTKSTKIPATPAPTTKPAPKTP